MTLIETPIKDAWLVKLKKLEDGRGFFARVYCFNELKEKGIDKRIAQMNCSYSHKKGTLRGLHYQAEPYSEIKIIRCIQGAIFDVIADVRPESESFGKWYGVELTQSNRDMLIVPEGCAHGYQTLTDEAEVIYPTTEFYSPKYERGIRWDDPFFNIQWPVANPIVSEKDSAFVDFKT